MRLEIDEFDLVNFLQQSIDRDNDRPTDHEALVALRNQQFDEVMKTKLSQYLAPDNVGFYYFCQQVVSEVSELRLTADTAVAFAQVRAAEPPAPFQSPRQAGTNAAPAAPTPMRELSAQPEKKEEPVADAYKDGW